MFEQGGNQFNVFKKQSLVDLDHDFPNIDGNVQAFILKMNQQAKKYKLKNTHYMNVHGLQNTLNKSCAYDQCLLSCISMQNPIVREIVIKKVHTITIDNVDGFSRLLTFQNTNKLLNDGFIGLKTGITKAAGACLSSTFSQYDQIINKQIHINLVVLGCQQVDDRFTDSSKLCEWAISQIQKQNLYN